MTESLPASQSNATRAAIETACATMASWLRTLPEWPKHPTNASGSVSSHFGPTILSEHDCVLHFARHLNDAGVPWNDQHLEFSPAQWMFTVSKDAWLPPKRIDLAVIRRDDLVSAVLPLEIGEFPLDAALEFALASNYWEFGAGGPAVARRKIAADVEKVAAYVSSGLAREGYVIVVEETDHKLPPEYALDKLAGSGVRVRVLRGWH